MKDVMLRARIVVGTSKCEISRRRVADYVKKNCIKKRAARAADGNLPHSTNHIIILICGIVVAVVIFR